MKTVINTTILAAIFLVSCVSHIGEDENQIRSLKENLTLEELFEESNKYQTYTDSIYQNAYRRLGELGVEEHEQIDFVKECVQNIEIRAHQRMEAFHKILPTLKNVSEEVGRAKLDSINEHYGLGSLGKNQVALHDLLSQEINNMIERRFTKKDN